VRTRVRPRSSGATSSTGRSKNARSSGIRSGAAVIPVERSGRTRRPGPGRMSAMVFKKLMASWGAVEASVETVVFEENVVPGGVVQVEVRIQGGSVPQRIEGLSVGLQARVEVEGDDGEYKQDVEFTRVQLGGAFEVEAGAAHVVPFGLEIPW